jgi:type IV pilus assembly protein PilO
MNLSEISWDLENAGTWPLPVKIVVVILSCIMVTTGWIYFDTQQQLSDLESEGKKEQALRQTFEIKQKKAANLDEYKRQLDDIEKTFGDLLRQLPDRTEVPELLVDVSQTGLASGLEFELFKPGGENIKEFYAELPIDIRVIGTYMEFGTFISGLASLPRIVTIHNVKITPQKEGKNAALVMEALVKTYRYLDENGIENPPKASNRK